MSYHCHVRTRLVHCANHVVKFIIIVIIIIIIIIIPILLLLLIILASFYHHLFQCKIRVIGLDVNPLTDQNHFTFNTNFSGG